VAAIYLKWMLALYLIEQSSGSSMSFGARASRSSPTATAIVIALATAMKALTARRTLSEHPWCKPLNPAEILQFKLSPIWLLLTSLHVQFFS
jgi:hypothetical protein